MKDWSAKQYLKFSDERSRAARDLINAIPRLSDKVGMSIIDIGCGPGNSTELLHHNWPQANLSGFDSSPDMINKAKSLLPNMDFNVADIRTWQVPINSDILFSNAVFQWLPDHIEVLKNIVGGMKKGSILAIQMPDNLQEPIHQAMIEVAQDPRWQDRIGAVARQKLDDVGVYYDVFAPIASNIDIWHSIYNHVMDGHEAIIDWVKGAALRPFLEPLNEAEQNSFLGLYFEKIKNAYPIQIDGKVLLRFPRFFMVLVK